MNFYTYDIETYPNAFTFGCEKIATGDRWYYEISERRNDLHELMNFLNAMRDSGALMVGFNNLHFDYPVVHNIIQSAAAWVNLGWQAVTAYIFQKVKEIFSSTNRFAHLIWQPIIQQVDLFKIHHFDNKAKSTSLKVLEFNMRSTNISDLPFEPGTHLTINQLPTLEKYNMHDVSETTKFFWHTKPMIDFRIELSRKYSRNFINHNDTKIGKDYFIMRLEEHAPGTCYYKSNQTGRKTPRQTSRDQGVNLSDVIFDYVQFEEPEFNRILQWMKAQTLTSKDLEDTLIKGVNTKGVFKGIHCTVDGFQYDFGTGGIHGSVDDTAVHANTEYELVDVDVASYYPNLAIANKLFPEHLGDLFVSIYKDVYEQRKSYSKKTAENAMLKLALNGVYGDSNNAYSPFFDPKYTMSITINGQLLLCMLAEQFLKIPNLSLIQINTDGMTVRVPRIYRDHLKQVMKWWENLTGLELEDVNYKSMYVRDVNNYIGVYEDGSAKTKGAYESRQPQDRIPLGWHQNMSALIVPKAAQAALVHGTDIDAFIRSPERDIMDFMCRTKVNRASKLMLVNDDKTEIEQQRVTRYFVAHRGGSLVKLSPPTKPHTIGTFKKAPKITDAEYFKHDPYVWNPKVHTKNQGVYKERRDGLSVGWKVEVCNDIRFANFGNVNHDYYISEARKLVECIK